MQKTLNLQKEVLGRVFLPFFSSYIALYVLKLWEDVEAETISLTAGSVSTIHKVSKSQN